MTDSKMTVPVWGRSIILLLLAAIASVQTLRSEASAQEPVNGPIAATALKYLDTHGGQCWTFMADVVAEATGRTIGFGYREGYLAAGAVEVTADEAQNGDIIQIVSDANNSPFASYSGLHTAIILENLGGGRFNAIDSNQSWDEWVKLRPNYDPYAAAARYGLQVHIYRIPGGGPGGAGVDTQPAAETVSWTAGAQAVVSTSGCLNLRAQPSLAGSRIDCVPTGTAVSVTGDAVEADGYTWLPVKVAQGTGWLAAEYISQTSAPVQVAAPPAVAQEAPASAVAGSTPAGASTVERTARTDNSPGCLRVRDGAGVTATIVDCLRAGTKVTLVDTPVIEQGGYSWTKVTVNGKTGWLAGEFLVS